MSVGYFYSDHCINVLTKSIVHTVNHPPQADNWNIDHGWSRVRADTNRSNPSRYRSDGSVISSARSGEQDYSDTDSDLPVDHDHLQTIDLLSTNLPQPPTPNNLAPSQPTEPPPPPPNNPVPNILPAYLLGVPTRVVEAARSYFPWLFVTLMAWQWQAIAISPCKFKHLLMFLKCSSYHSVLAIAFVSVICSVIFLDYWPAGIAAPWACLGSDINSDNPNIIPPDLRNRL